MSLYGWVSSISWNGSRLKCYLIRKCSDLGSFQTWSKCKWYPGQILELFWKGDHNHRFAFIETNSIQTVDRLHIQCITFGSKIICSLISCCCFFIFYQHLSNREACFLDDNRCFFIVKGHLQTRGCSCIRGWLSTWVSTRHSFFTTLSVQALTQRLTNYIAQVLYTVYTVYCRLYTQCS